MSALPTAQALEGRRVRDAGACPTCSGTAAPCSSPPTPQPRRLLAEHWKVADLARELGVRVHTLVEASRRGDFCRLVRLGKCWFAPAQDVIAWFERQHAEPINPLMLDRIRAAGTPAGGRLRRRRRA